MKTREEALNNLLLYQSDLNQLVNDLNRFPWDSDTVFATLNYLHITKIIMRYLNGELTEQQLEDWANAVECREDIDFDPAQQNVLAEAIHQLANPLLTVSITAENMMQLLQDIKPIS